MGLPSIHECYLHAVAARAPGAGAHSSNPTHDDKSYLYVDFAAADEKFDGGKVILGMVARNTTRTLNMKIGTISTGYKLTGTIDPMGATWRNDDDYVIEAKIHFDATKYKSAAPFGEYGCKPLDDLAISAQEPLLVEVQTKDQEQNGYIHKGNLGEQFGMSFVVDIDEAQTVIAILKQLRKQAFDGYWNITFVDDECPAGVLVQLVEFNARKIKGMGIRTYQCSMTLERVDH